LKIAVTLCRKGIRILVRGMIAAFCVAGCLAEYFARGAAGLLNPSGRATVLQNWSARLLAGLKVEIVVDGGVPGPGLIVSNHLSYLDILVFSVVCRCVFVSKQEVRSWPGVGWVASLAGTIYIDRTRRSDTHAVQPEMQSALASGLRLVLFPEGTSTDGSTILKFHSSLFQPALDLNAQISAAAIAYSLPDGDAATEACYWGDMSLLPHLLNLLTKDSIQASVKFSSEPLRFTDRKQAARTMQVKVEDLRTVSTGVPG
jgi:lyso-ornithine lipid O-acyltransferase